MLTFKKIRFLCQNSTAFINNNNCRYNLILFSCAKFLRSSYKEVAISVYCLLLIDRVPSPIPDKIIVNLRVRLALRNLVYRYRR